MLPSRSTRWGARPAQLEREVDAIVRDLLASRQDVAPYEPGDVVDDIFAKRAEARSSGPATI